VAFLLWGGALMWLMRRASSVDGCGHRGSVRFGGFCSEVVAGRGLADCSGLQTLGYGLMMAGIGGRYAQVSRGSMRGGWGVAH